MIVLIIMHMACRFCILTPKIGMAWMALNNQAGEQLLLITATTVHRRSYRAALLHDKKKRGQPFCNKVLGWGY
jgi:hypothetical protein